MSAEESQGNTLTRNAKGLDIDSEVEGKMEVL